MPDLAKDTYYESPGLWKGEPEPYQVQVRQDLSALVPDGVASVLDAGCGNGLITNALPPRLRVVGLDQSHAALRHVRRRACRAAIEQLPFADRAFDLVMATDVLEHVPDASLARCRAELFRAAADHVVLTVPLLEDLAAGENACGSCGHVAHRNRHVRSFDLEALPALAADGWTLGFVALSGADWGDEPVEVARLRHAMGHAASAPGRCPRCGEPFAAVPPDAAEEEFVATIAAMLSAQDVARGGHAACRTEAICCFHRHDAGNPWQQAAAAAVPGAVVEIDPNRIDFRDPSARLFRRAHVPSHGVRGYFHAAGEAPGPEGLRLAAEQEVKVGFFAAGEGDWVVAGAARGAARLQVQFHDGRGYRSVATLDVHGPFDQRLPAAGRLPSGPFGRLAALRCLAGELALHRCHLDVAAPRQRLRWLDEPRPAFVALPWDQPRLALSTRWYEAAMPEPQAVVRGLRGRAEDLRAAPRAAGDARRRTFAALQSLLAREARRQQQHAAGLEAAHDAAAAQAVLLERLERLERDNAGLRARIASLEGDLAGQQAPAAELAARLDRLRLPERALDLAARAVRSVRDRWRAPAAAPAWQPRTAVMLVPDDRIDRRVLLEARSLVLAGWRVRVVGAPPPNPGYTDDEDQFPEVGICRVDASRPQAVPAALQPPAVPPGEADWSDFYWLTNHYYLRACEQPFQVVVAHDLPVLPAAAMAAARHGAFLVYDAHELYPEQHHFGAERSERYRRAEQVLAPLADVVITVNESIARELERRYGVRAPQVILNCPAVPADGVPAPTGEELRSPGLRADQRILLYQGALSLGRNLEPLVAAMALVRRRDVALVLMGPGDEKRAELQDIARRDGTLGTRVFFRAPVAQQDILRYSGAADAGIIPYPHLDLNSYYCTPNKLFDFLAAGVPILANDSPELRRFVADQGVGMVHPFTDAAAIADGIDRFFAVDHAPFRARLREVGGRFTWQHEGGTLVRVYEQMVAAAAPAVRRRN